LDSVLEHERQVLNSLTPMVNGITNDAFYEQKRRVYQIEQHLDELCAKVKFYIRKIDIDSENVEQPI